jgi:hypothetical protein
MASISMKRGPRGLSPHDGIRARRVS